MSRRYEASSRRTNRLDGLKDRFSSNVVPALHDVRPFDKIYFVSQNRLQFFLHSSQVQQGLAHFLFELGQNVNVTVRLEVIPNSRTKQSKYQDAPTFTE